MDENKTSDQQKSYYQIVIDRCNNFYRRGNKLNNGRVCPFIVENDCVGNVGLIREEFIPELLKYPDVFIHQKAFGLRPETVTLSPNLTTPEHRTEKLEEVLKDLHKKNKFPTLRGWRNEKHDIKKRFHEKTVFSVERSATPIFGFVNYGVHINGYFYNDSGEMMMWLGQRSPNKATFPNKLDNLVAGGLASGIGVIENAIKECQEEASIDEKTLSNLVSAGTVSYCYEDERGILPECQFIYDLKLTSDFNPVNADGEVGNFHCYPLSKVQELIVTDEFKPNCALIILDFLIRHGVVTPENEPHYTSLVEDMHKPLAQLFS